MPKNSAPPVVLALTERWDHARTKDLAARAADLPPEVRAGLKAALKKMYGSGPTRRLKTEYSQAKSTPAFGRLYARGPSLQNMPGWMRRLVAGGEYHDIDMVNAAPTLLYGLGKGMDLDLPTLERYVDEREEVLEMIMETGPRITRGVAKEAVLSVLYFGSGRTALANAAASVDEQGDIERGEALAAAAPAGKVHDFFNELAADRDTLYTALVAADEQKDVVAALKNHSEGNAKGRFLAHVYCKYEAQVLEAIQMKLTTLGYRVDCLVFDGLMVARQPDDNSASRKRHGSSALDGSASEDEGHANMEDDGESEDASGPSFSLAALRACEAHVKTKTGLDVQLLEKPLAARKEDIARLEGPPQLDGLGPFARFVAILTQNASNHRLRRLGDQVMRPHATVPRVYEPSGETSQEYVNRLLRHDDVFQGAENVTALVKWFNVQDHPDFPIIIPQAVSRRHIAFTNGVVDVQACKFYKTGDPAIPPDLVTLHFFDVAFDDDLMEKPTPYWDKLIGHQLRDPDLAEAEQEARVECFEAFIGRLFFPVGFDNWQRWLFLLGAANTGKSTVLNVLRKAFPANSVGVISSNFEKQFGYENMANCCLLMMPDVPEDLGQILPRELLQSVISGEQVPIARKHKAAGKSVRWQVPGIMAGNKVPKYENPGGAMSRRFVVFPFTTPVSERDTQLERKIVAEELPTIVLRCLLSYSNLRQRVGEGDLVPHLPPSIAEGEERLYQETSLLYQFLVDGDEYYTFIRSDDAQTKLADVKTAFQNHIRLRHPGTKFKWSSDYHPFAKAGYRVEETNMCKVCHRKSSKSGCDHFHEPAGHWCSQCGRTASKETCNHWHGGKNRAKLMVVLGMRMEKRDTHNDKRSRQGSKDPADPEDDEDE